MAYIRRGSRYARQVMENPHPYYTNVVTVYKHPEVKAEWIERTVVKPHLAEQAPGYTNRNLYYCYIPEFKTGRWLMVVVENDQLFNAYFKHSLLARFGRPT